MKIAIFHPYGSTSPETPLIWLFSKYLNQCGHEITQVMCDGCFGVCDRNLKPSNGFSRPVSECFNCMRDSTELYDSDGIALRKFSDFLSPAEVRESYHWSLGLDVNRVSSSTSEDFYLYELCKDSLRKRFGQARSAFSVVGAEEELKSMLLSAKRMLKISENFNNRVAPDLCLVAGDDFLTSCFRAVLEVQDVQIARFAWDKISKTVNVTHPETGVGYTPDYSRMNLKQFMTNIEEWPIEVFEMLKDMMCFLEIPASQLRLFAVS